MKELIDPHQADLLMLAVLFGAPIVGLLWGAFTKRIRPGLIIGLLVGVGNYVLWTVYNAITDKLGLDTVKNLVVNLVLFIILGILIGLGAAWYNGRGRKENN
ncbi:MAG: hypothetical protein M3Y28_10740 [Armatimonadota bacterium]|nr:hypothetical protein [Armatimonadota bacterium]